MACLKFDRGVDARQQFLPVCGLGQEIIRSRFDPGDVVFPRP